MLTRLIDSELAKHDLTVPDSTPQLILDASAHFAAWLFRHRRDPAGAAAFKEEAETFLAGLPSEPGRGWC